MYVLIFVYIYDCFKLLVFSFQMHFKILHLYSHPLTIIGLDNHICLWTISYIYCMFAFTSELSHLAIFLYLVVAFSFPPKEVPLAFVVKLVWWC